MISPRTRTHHLLVVLIMLRVPVLPLTRLHLLALAERLVGLAVAGHLSRYLPFHTQACDESARIAPREHCCTTQPVIHGTRSRHTVRSPACSIRFPPPRATVRVCSRQPASTSVVVEAHWPVTARTGRTVWVLVAAATSMSRGSVSVGQLAELHKTPQRIRNIWCEWVRAALLRHSVARDYVPRHLSCTPPQRVNTTISACILEWCGAAAPVHIRSLHSPGERSAKTLTP
jgi:hypothetical protein